MSSMAPSNATVDFGRLANNFILVQSLQSALSRAEMNANTIPKLVSRVIREKAWEEWIVPETSDISGWKDRESGRVNPADFREFIRSDRPKGCACPVHVFERMIWETQAWDDYQGLLRGEPGARKGHPVYPDRDKDSGQFVKPINRDVITVNGEEPNTIPFAPAVPARDYTREASTGTSLSYLLRRLSKAAPDAYERVKRGEVTAYRAAVNAGLVEPKISVPHDPDRAARILFKHLGPDQTKALIVALSHAAGFTIETV